MSYLSDKITFLSSDFSIFIAIFAAAVATFLTRVLAYLFLKGKKPKSQLLYLQENMGLMIMVILVFYALNSTKFSVYPYGVPEIIATIIAILTQIYAKNGLLSIGFSTIIYMILTKLIN